MTVVCGMDRKYEDVHKMNSSYKSMTDQTSMKDFLGLEKKGEEREEMVNT